MQKLKNQRGFTGFEIVIVIVALLAIGAAGYYAYQARQNQGDYSVIVPHKKPAPVPTTQAPAPTAAQPIDEKAAVQAAALTAMNAQVRSSDPNADITQTVCRVDSVQGTTASGFCGVANGGGQNFTASKTNGVWQVTISQSTAG